MKSSVGRFVGFWCFLLCFGANANEIEDNVAAQISAITAKAVPITGDFFLIEDSAASDAKKSVTFGAMESATNHDNLSGFVADEHVAHAGVSVVAGTGLTGGGAIDATRTLNVIAGDGLKANADDIELDINSLPLTFSLSTTDAFAIEDVGAGEDRRVTYFLLNSSLDHDILTNFVADEHVDWTSPNAGTMHNSNYVGGEFFVLDRFGGYAVTAINSTPYVSVYSFSVSANMLIDNDDLLFEFDGIILNDSGIGIRTYSMQILYGGTALWDGAISAALSSSSSVLHPVSLQLVISCLNSETSKRMSGNLSTYTAAANPTTGYGNPMGTNNSGPIATSAAFSADNTSAQTLEVKLKSSSTNTTQEFNLQSVRLVQQAN